MSIESENDALLDIFQIPGNDNISNVDASGKNLIWATYRSLFFYDGNNAEFFLDETKIIDLARLPYLYGMGADRGAEIFRFQNIENSTFMYASPEEAIAIENDPELANLLVNQGVAFQALI